MEYNLQKNNKQTAYVTCPVSLKKKSEDFKMLQTLIKTY